MSKRRERKNADLPKASSSRAERRAERRSSRRQLDKPTVTQRNRDSNAPSDVLQKSLANPTKVVTEEQLHEEYGYVLADLRNMFILAGALMVLLVILAQFI